MISKNKNPKTLLTKPTWGLTLLPKQNENELITTVPADETHFVTVTESLTNFDTTTITPFKSKFSTTNETVDTTTTTATITTTFSDKQNSVIRPLIGRRLPARRRKISRNSVQRKLSLRNRVLSKPKLDNDNDVKAYKNTDKTQSNTNLKHKKETADTLVIPTTPQTGDVVTTLDEISPIT